MSGAAPRLRVLDLALFERAMTFTHPFRFGSVTVAAAPQAFVRARIELEGASATGAIGASAEMMMPRWFDKNPAKPPAETIDDLRASLAAAAGVYRSAGPDTAFGLHAAAYPVQGRWAASRGLPALVAAYGPALIDKAVLDALLKARGLDLARCLIANVAGLDTRLTPDLDPADLEAFLDAVAPAPRVALRHTVGLLDALEGRDGLAEAVAGTGITHYKLKLSGDPGPDVERLRALARLLPRLAPDFRASLDANEGYAPDALAGLLDAIRDDPALAPLRDALLYVEQPYDRAATFTTPLGPWSEKVPFIIDEADDAYDAFPRAAALGYRGVSSKSCKGLYKSILNAARARAWNRAAGADAYFVAGEDLTTQAGLGVEQDTALVAALGLAHAERNGHHYVAGFGSAPEGEARAFADAHPDLYARRDGRLALRVGDGGLPTASLFARAGLAGGAVPDWASLQPLATFEEITT